MNTTKTIVGVGGRYMCGVVDLVCDHFERVHPSVEVARLGSRRVGQPGHSRKMMRQCQMRREGNTTQHMCESGLSNSGASPPLCTSAASRYIYAGKKSNHLVLPLRPL